MDLIANFELTGALGCAVIAAWLFLAGPKLMAEMQPPVDEQVMLRTIRMVEDAQRFQRGSHGERGYWQMTEVVWNSYSKKPFYWLERYDDLDAQIEVQRVCTAHLRWIMERIRVQDKPVTPYNVALVWNGGAGAFRRRSCTAATKDYAQRAKNIYEGLVTSAHR